MMRFVLIVLFLGLITRAAELPSQDLQTIKSDLKLLFQGTDFDSPVKKTRLNFFDTGRMRNLLNDKIMQPGAPFAYFGQTYENAHHLAHYITQQVEIHYSLFVIQQLSRDIPIMIELEKKYRVFIQDFLSNNELSALAIPNYISIDTCWSNECLRSTPHYNWTRSFLLLAAEKNNVALFNDLLEKGADPHLFFDELCERGRYGCLTVLKNYRFEKSRTEILSCFISRIEKFFHNDDDDKTLQLLLSMNMNDSSYKAQDVLNLLLIMRKKQQVCKDYLSQKDKQWYQELCAVFTAQTRVVSECVKLLENEYNRKTQINDQARWYYTTCR